MDERRDSGQGWVPVWARQDAGASAAELPFLRERVRAALSGTGWEAALDYVPRHRLGKNGFRLALEPR